MTNILKQKSVKCLEWTVETPPSGLTAVSETFPLLNRECHFEFHSGNACVIYPCTSCLCFKSNGEMPLHLTITVRIVSNSKTLDHETTSITSANQQIWNNPKIVFQTYLLTFDIIIYVDSLQVDKCMQTAPYLNAVVSMGSLTEDFSKLLETGLDHDVEMHCGGHFLKAHKIVLSARSEVFKAMLHNNMLEVQTGVVEIQDMDIISFRDFIRYLYTDELPEMSFDIAKTLYEAGDKYAVRSLSLRCSEYLQDNLTPENAYQCFSLADAHSDQELKNRDCRCYLELKIGAWSGSSYGASNLNFKSSGKLQWPVTITVRVPIAPDTINSQARNVQETSITSEYQTIWSFYCGDLLNKMLTFEVVIHADSLTVDRSIQTPSYIDKCSLLDDISRDFSKLLDENVNHDVEFTCGEQTIKAHKNVLCCRSSVFAAMMQTDMVEGQTGSVNIVDMDADIFQQLVKCLYTGILPKLTLTNALQFYNAGDKYDIGALKKQCAEFLIDNLSPENACDILIVADRHIDTDFKNSIIEYMMEEKIPSMADKWTDFCKENPVLANEVLNSFCQHLLSK